METTMLVKLYKNKPYILMVRTTGKMVVDLLEPTLGMNHGGISSVTQYQYGNYGNGNIHHSHMNGIPIYEWY